MSEYIGKEQAQQAADYGVKIGETEPCHKTNCPWWQVMVYQGRLFACSTWPGQGVIGGEEITADELPLYCDDPDAARRVLALELQRTTPGPG